jgi:hypothetical protein
MMKRSITVLKSILHPIVIGGLVLRPIVGRSHIEWNDHLYLAVVTHMLQGYHPAGGAVVALGV